MAYKFNHSNSGENGSQAQDSGDSSDAGSDRSEQPQESLERHKLPKRSSSMTADKSAKGISSATLLNQVDCHSARPVETSKTILERRRRTSTRRRTDTSSSSFTEHVYEATHALVQTPCSQSSLSLDADSLAMLSGPPECAEHIAMNGAPSNADYMTHHHNSMLTCKTNSPEHHKLMPLQEIKPLETHMLETLHHTQLEHSMPIHGAPCAQPAINIPGTDVSMTLEPLRHTGECVSTSGVNCSSLESSITAEFELAMGGTDVNGQPLELDTLDTSCGGGELLDQLQLDQINNLLCFRKSGAPELENDTNLSNITHPSACGTGSMGGTSGFPMDLDKELIYMLSTSSNSNVSFLI